MTTLYLCILTSSLSFIFCFLRGLRRSPDVLDPDQFLTVAEAQATLERELKDLFDSVSR